MNIEQLYQLYRNHPIVSTDTRSITEKCLFFALKGDSFDANTLAEQAISHGAAYAIIDNPQYKKGAQYIVVEDVLTTLQELAKYHRKHLGIPIIAATGSNGKTTTKELTRAVLAERFRVFSTKGNLNNHIGVPLSILSIPKEAEMAIIEMGANHLKEIEHLCEIAQPTHGIISNVGLAHLEGFGGFEGVKKGKGELYAYLGEHHGYAFVNAANPHLVEMVNKGGVENIVYYNDGTADTVNGHIKQHDPFIEIEWRQNHQAYLAKTNLTGDYNLENVLAAVGVGMFFGLTPQEINKGLANYFPSNNRSQLTKTNSNTIICDFYNANPTSMAAALNNLGSLTASQKAAILGDMFELGEEAEAQHEKIIQQAVELHLNHLIFVGHHFYAYKEKYKATFFPSIAEAEQYLMENSLKNNLVLLKGSRGMTLERLLPVL